jgi:U3 small nucleolar RNA-associated protein 11
MVSTAGKKPGGKTVTQGRHGARSDASLSVETVRLLKTQDAGYLRVMGEKVRRELEGLEREVRLQEGIKGVLDGGKAKTKTGTKTDGGKVVFVESVEEQRRRRAGLEESDGTDSDEEDDRPAQGNSTTTKTKKHLEEEESLRREIRAAKRMKKRAAETRLRKLEALKKQHHDIVAAERELDWQRGRMDNAVGGVNKNGVKWKIRERKR